MSKNRQYELDQTNSQIIDKINSDFSYRNENNIDRCLMKKDNEIMNLCELNKSLISKIEHLKKEKVTHEFQITSLKTDLNSAEIDKNILIEENQKLVEQIKELNKLLNIKGNKMDEISKKNDNSDYSLTEKLLLKDKEILNMQEIIYKLKEENKMIFNLENEIEEKNKDILKLEKYIKKLENQNLIKDTKFQDNYHDNYSTDYNNEKLISFILDHIKKVELAIDQNFGSYNNNFCNYNTSLNKEDSIYDIIKNNFYLLINKINNLDKDNFRNKKNILNQLETEKNKNIELPSKIKELEHLSQNEDIDNDKNNIDMEFKDNFNSYLDEIENLNLKIKKLSVLSKKNENLLKTLTEENKDLKLKNYELMKGKADRSNNNNRFGKINNYNKASSNNDHSTYSDLREKISTMELNNLISLNRKEDNNILDLQNETNELIKENYVGNIHNINDTNYNNLNNNNLYLFKNEKEKMRFNGDHANEEEEIINENYNNINNELEYDN